MLSSCPEQVGVVLADVHGQLLSVPGGGSLVKTLIASRDEMPPGPALQPGCVMTPVSGAHGLQLTSEMRSLSAFVSSIHSPKELGGIPPACLPCHMPIQPHAHPCSLRPLAGLGVGVTW